MKTKRTKSPTADQLLAGVMKLEHWLQAHPFHCVETENSAHDATFIVWDSDAERVVAEADTLAELGDALPEAS